MKKMAASAFLIIVGLILTGYAILAPMLQIIGTRATGIITDVRRQGGERDEMTRNLHNNGVGFYFLLPDGRKIEGGATIIGKSYSAGISKDPVSVLHLNFIPRIHELEKYTQFYMENLISIANCFF